MSNETRKPVRFANYAADVRQMVGRIYGPNLFGEHMVAVSADFDGTKTRVGFAYATTSDMALDA